ncbi:hypothetical protein Tco_1291727 [Tanacetum coccineum]
MSKLTTVTTVRSERTIQTIEDMLRAYVMDFGGSWDTHLSLDVKTAEAKEEFLSKSLLELRQGAEYTWERRRLIQDKVHRIFLPPLVVLSGFCLILDLVTSDFITFVIMEYLLNISKRRAFRSLNEDILKINDSDYQYAVSIKEDTAYLCLHSPKTTKKTKLNTLYLEKLNTSYSRYSTVFGVDMNTRRWRYSLKNLEPPTSLLSELKIEVNKLSNVVSNVLIPKNEVKGVTTRGGKMTSKATHTKEINEIGINENEPSRFEQDVQEKLHDDGEKNKSSSIIKDFSTLVNPQQL